MLRGIFWKRALPGSPLAESLTFIFQNKREHIQKQRDKLCKGWSSLVSPKSPEGCAFAGLRSNP